MSSLAASPSLDAVWTAGETPAAPSSAQQKRCDKAAAPHLPCPAEHAVRASSTQTLELDPKFNVSNWCCAVGGNHEASNHLWELYYGGWVAPNIYYLGHAGVVNFGGLRIGGLSGIFMEHNYSRVSAHACTGTV